MGGHLNPSPPPPPHTHTHTYIYTYEAPFYKSWICPCSVYTLHGQILEVMTSAIKVLGGWHLQFVQIIAPPSSALRSLNLQISWKHLRIPSLNHMCYCSLWLDTCIGNVSGYHWVIPHCSHSLKPFIFPALNQNVLFRGVEISCPTCPTWSRWHQCNSIFHFFNQFLWTHWHNVTVMLYGNIVWILTS